MTASSKLDGTSDNRNPELWVTIKKKLNQLTFVYDNEPVVFDIVNGKIDVILLDMWLTEIFKTEWEKEQERTKLKRRLSGEDV